MDSNGFIIKDGILTEYFGTNKQPTVPDGVREIGDGAFRNRKITAVFLPNTLRIIGKSAFYGCSSLEYAVLPPGLEIVGAEAFRECPLSKTVIECEKLETIGGRAFFGCTGLTLAVLQNTKSIGEEAFFGCTSLEKVFIPSISSLGKGAFSGCIGLMEITLSDSLSEIPDRCFWGCDEMMEITLSAKLQHLGVEAFSECGMLGGIDIPEGVTEISDMAFSGCGSLKEAVLHDGLKRIGKSAFYFCGLKKVQVPSSVTEIDDEAFCDCGSLGKVTLSDGLLRIGNRVFCDCSCLESIEIPESLRSIGRNVFMRSGIEEYIRIPKNTVGLTHLFEKDNVPAMIEAPGAVVQQCPPIIRHSVVLGFVNMLYNGENVTQPTLDECISHISRTKERLYHLLPGNMALLSFMTEHRLIPSEEADALIEKCDTANVEAYATLTAYRQSFKSADDDFDDWLTDEAVATGGIYGFRFSANPDGTLSVTGYSGTGKNVEIPSYVGKKAVTAIAPLAFSPVRSHISVTAKQRVDNIENIIVPEGIKQIGERAFYHCSSLVAVSLPSTLECIEDQVFMDCTKLSHVSVTAPIGKVQVGKSVFLGCESLKEIFFPDGYDNFGVGLFWGCKLLSEVSFPKGLTMIPDYCFGNCSELKRIVVREKGHNVVTGEKAFAQSKLDICCIDS